MLERCHQRLAGQLAHLGVVTADGRRHRGIDGAVHGNHRDLGALGSIEGGADRIRVDGIDDQHVNLAGQQVLDIVVLLADVAVGIKENQLIAVLGRSGLGAVTQLYIERRL